MWDSIIAFKDSIINKFGPILGYGIIIIGALIALSILGFLFKILFYVALGLTIAGLVLLGINKFSEWLKANKR